MIITQIIALNAINLLTILICSIMDNNAFKIVLIKKVIISQLDKLYNYLYFLKI